MAEGLLQHPSTGSTLEEVGYHYFNDLASRSFFQHSKTDENSFMMHDLMHDLAIFYGGKLFFRTFELETADKPRHLSYDPGLNDSFSKTLEACGSSKNARTLLNIRKRFASSGAVDPCGLLAELKHVRVLSFTFSPLEDDDSDSLIDSIGDLIHLRYLDLSTTPIVTLPESMSKLYNLKILKLSHCERLEKLPSNMQDLINLRHLDLSGTPIVELPESLSKLYNLQTLKLIGCGDLKKLPTDMQDLVNLHRLDIEDTYLEEMPKGMSKLKDLQILRYYIVGKDEENGIGELGELVNLKGSFRIEKLENVVNSSEALKARMVDKRYITNLCLEWSSGEEGDIVDSQTKKDVLDKYGDIVDSEVERDVLAKLKPHNNSKRLTIMGYGGMVFPEWVGQSWYHNMTELKLSGCWNCLVLPSLGQLPSLESLDISEFDKLKKIGGEFCKGDGADCLQDTPFRSLKTLAIFEMPCLEEWESYACDDDVPFPQLETLRIWNSPKLRGDLPSSFLPALKELGISGCEELGCYLPRAPILSHLQICGTKEARILELPLSMLQILSVDGEQQVEYVFDAMTHTQPTSLEELRISNCSTAISFPGDSLPPSLKELSIYNCKNLEFPMQRPQHHSLERLVIDSSCDSLTSFALPAFPNLKSLTIASCENLGSLEEVPQSHSLRQLSIYGCPKLESIIRLPASLESLNINQCPLLGEGIERKDSHIWPSISLIPRIIVDGKWICNDSTS